MITGKTSALVEAVLSMEKAFKSSQPANGLAEMQRAIDLAHEARAEHERAIAEIYRDECCPHDETENGVCSDCGEDRTEHMMAHAYDRAKDIRKYGS